LEGAHVLNSNYLQVSRKSFSNYVVLHAGKKEQKTRKTIRTRQVNHINLLNHKMANTNQMDQNITQYSH
jgi:hypothetical protein